jgi:hypothetical protein
MAGADIGRVGALAAHLQGGPDRPHCTAVGPAAHSRGPHGDLQCHVHPAGAAASATGAAEPAQILSSADHAFWRENGYLVVPNAVPRAYCEAIKADLFTGLALDPRNPESWYEGMPARFRNGFVRMIQAQSMWDCRQCPRIHQIFSELHGTAQLFVSQDQAAMKLPFRTIALDGAAQTFGDGGVYFGLGDVRNRIGGLHWDGAWAVQQEAGGRWTPKLIDYGAGRGVVPVDETNHCQGVLYLNDRGEDGGGFRCVPGFARRWRAWLDTVPPSRSMAEADGGHVIVNHPELAAELEPLARTIPAAAGSLVIWHRLTPHSNGRNTSATPRFAMYITMGPGRESRAKSIERWRKTSDESEPNLDWEQSLPPATLSPLGRQLLGLDLW